MQKQSLVAKINIYKNDARYQQLEWLGIQATNIYNAANYFVRQSLFKDGQMKFYGDIDRYFKFARKSNQSNLYNIVQVQFAQQIYRNLDKNWKSWRESRKEFLINPQKFSGKPKIPKYKKKGKPSVFYFSNQMFQIIDHKLVFAKTKKNGDFKRNVQNWKKVLTGIKIPTHIDKIQQIRCVKHNTYYSLELIYEIEIDDLKQDNGRYFSIDPGLNNLLTVVSNVKEFEPIIINGKPIKSINQYFNKKNAYLKSIAQKSNKLHSTDRTRKLLDKRDNKINDYFHKASKSIIDTALSYDISKIIIGNGATNSKQNFKSSKRMNQNFLQIPFSKLISMIIYKAKLAGIEVIMTEESYTSQTSFLDGEAPIKVNGDKFRKTNSLKPRRIKRGLFHSDNGHLINADVNGAFQILKKVVPNAYADGIEGLGLSPVKKLSF